MNYSSAIIEAALVSQDVYNDKNKPVSDKLLAYGWRRGLEYSLDDFSEDFCAGGYARELFSAWNPIMLPIYLTGKLNLPKIIRYLSLVPGFFGRLYLKADRAIIAYRGTVCYYPNNLIEDLDLSLVGSVSYKKLAKWFFHLCLGFLQKIHCYKIMLTGHSLGGYLAMQMAMDNPTLSCVVFNAPGFGSLERINAHWEHRDNINNVVINYDDVHRVGTQPGVLTVINEKSAPPPPSDVLPYRNSYEIYRGFYYDHSIDRVVSLLLG